MRRRCLLPRRPSARPRSRLSGSGEVRNTCSAVWISRSTLSRTSGIQLRERVVQQQHRRGAGRLTHRQHLGQPQRQGQQPLLAPRAERPRIDAVQLDRRDRPDAGPTSVWPRRISSAPRPLERRHQGRRLGRLARRRCDTVTSTLGCRHR